MNEQGNCVLIVQAWRKHAITA